jgi:hypothetical protein
MVWSGPDGPLALAVARLVDALRARADRVARGHQTAWPTPGRKRMFLCAERDAHEGSLRALMRPSSRGGARRAGS